VSVNPYSQPEIQSHAEESVTLSSLPSVQGGWHYGLPETVMISSLGLAQAHTSVESLVKWLAHTS